MSDEMKREGVPLVNPTALPTMKQVFEQSIERHAKTEEICEKLADKFEDPSDEMWRLLPSSEEVEVMRRGVQLLHDSAMEDREVCEDGLAEVNQALAKYGSDGGQG